MNANNTPLRHVGAARARYSFSPAVARPSEAAVWLAARRQVAVIARLAPDWDGGDSPAAAPGIAASTLVLLRELWEKSYPPPTDLYPTPGGTLTVEWQFPGDVIVRIEVDGRERGELMVSYPGGECRFERVRWAAGVSAGPRLLVRKTAQSDLWGVRVRGGRGENPLAA